MSDITPDQQDTDLIVGNYVVAFIDLLGQRAALQGQGLLPIVETDEQKRQLLSTLKESVGSISSLQRHARDMARAAQPNPNSLLRAKLPHEQQSQWDEMQKTRVVTQHWSDGLMLFANLGDSQIKCHLNNVFQIITLAGALCFIGLGSKRPLRGGIEIAWGVELNPGELYGAAVARAYELESEVADYPRIVVGSQMVRFLDLQIANPSASPYDQVNKELAALCRSMLVEDADGRWLVHYLGDAFADGVSGLDHRKLYDQALAFVVEQLKLHQKRRDTKLAFRYIHLYQYFLAHKPPGPVKGGA